MAKVGQFLKIDIPPPPYIVKNTDKMQKEKERENDI